MTARQFSKYFYGLSEDAKARYIQKMDKISPTMNDPLTLSEETDVLPSVVYPDIFNFLISTPSRYTADNLKAYKNLDGYKYLLAGWVGHVSSFDVGDSQRFVVRAKVRHSQTMSALPAKPWIAAESGGTVLASHCDCMAGLGEVCSHISALLFTIEAHTNFIQDQACTSQPCQWIQPTLKAVKYAPISEIDFSAPKTKRKNCSSNTTTSPASSKLPSVAAPTASELEQLFSDLSASGLKPAILSIIPGYSKMFVVDRAISSPPLTSLFEEKCLDLPFDKLLKECESTFSQLAINKEQAANIAAMTREQARSRDWFRFRAGRITASRFKASVRTCLEKPSISLIRAICYPESATFSTKATRWGCDHEKTARDAYIKKIQEEHTDLVVSDMGLMIDPQLPFMGATPDGLVTCSCCGDRVVEVKCPYSCKDKSFLEATEHSSFCLEATGQDEFELKTSHAYYYQMQLQMRVCGVPCGDFVVWKNDELIVLQIPRDDDFLKININLAKDFFRKCILPELLGKWYTRQL